MIDAKELRSVAYGDDNGAWRALLVDAADEIERLRAEVEQLRVRLEVSRSIAAGDLDPVLDDALAGGATPSPAMSKLAQMDRDLFGAESPASERLITRAEFQREIEAHAARTPNFIRTLLDKPWESWPLLLRHDICMKLGVEPVQMFRRVTDHPEGSQP